MGFKKMGLISEFLGFLFLTGKLLCMAQGNVNYYDFILKETNFTRLCSTKSILTVNGSFPGPVLRVHKGDTIYVNVHNHGQYGVTLHWHGVKQPRNPWSDGPEYITQCAIQPGSNFTYEVIFSREEGTLWWHAHSDWTRATVHGPLIILPAVGTTYPFPTPDEEETIVLASWFKEDVMTMMVQAFATGGDFDLSDAFTINGQPGDLCPCSKVEFDTTIPTAILQYRGNYTPPQSPYPATLPAYNDSKAATDFTSRTRSLASLEHPINVPKNITTRMFITLSLNNVHSANSSSYRLAASLNNLSFVEPSIDILLAYYRNLSGIYDADFPDKPPSLFNFTGDDLTSDNFLIPSRGTKVKVLNYNEAVEIVFQGTNVYKGSVVHPMHLHGHSFYVVGSGYGNFNNETDPNSYNLIDPPEASTIGVPKDGWTAIRFVANNPGVWLMHCHMDRHYSWGMNNAFIVKNGGTTATSIRPPPAYLPPCRVSAIDPLQPVNIDHLSHVIT